MLWNNIDWKAVINTVRQLQQKIAEAFIANDFKKVKELQDTLVRTFAARALAVRKVYQN